MVADFNKIVKRSRAEVNPSKYETVDAPHLRIIDQELWERARLKQAQLSHRLVSSAKNHLTGSQRARYQFSGHIECGVCASPMRIIGKDRYGCSRHAKHQGCDNTRTISRHDLESRVNGAIPDVVLALTSMQEVQERAASRQKAQRREAGKQANSKAARVTVLEKEIGNFLRAIAAGVISDAVVQSLNKAEGEKAKLLAELASPEPPVGKEVAAPQLSLSIIRTTAEAVAALLPDMTATSPVVLEYRQFVLQLVEKIVVHPEGKRGTSIEVHGRLASLLATVKAWEDEEKRLRSIWMRRFIAERKAGALARSEEKLQFLELMNREIEKRKHSFEYFLHQTSVVAGAGFEPATFRL